MKDIDKNKEQLIGELARMRQRIAELEASEAKFRTLSEQLPLGISIIAPGGTYEYINSKFSEISGYTLEDFHNGRQWFRLAFPDMQYKKKLISEWLQDLKEKDAGEIRPRAFTITCKDGTEKDIYLRAVSMPGGRQICSWEDITERKRMEEQIQVQKAYFESIFQYSREGMVILDTNNDILDANVGFENIFGYRLEEIKEKRLDDLIVPERLYYGEAKELDRMALDGILGYETVRKKKDGTEIDVSISAGPIRVRGEPRGRFAVFRDITERKRAETELKETKDRLSEIADDIAIPAFAIDKEHRLTNWNTALEALSDVKRGDVVGTSKQWLAFCSYERPVVADLIVDGASEDEIKKYYRGKYKKSSLIEGAYEAEDFFSELGEDGKWLHFTAAPIKGEAGEVVAAIETLEDITGRKQAEQFSEVLLHSVGVAVFIIQDGKIQYVNPMFLEQSGYTNEEIIGTYSFDLVHPEDRELVRKKAIEHLKERSALLYEYRFLRKDGETMWVLERVVPTQYRGKLAVIGYFVDITERKQAEERLKLLSDALEASVDGIAVADMEGNIAFSNKALCQMWGYSPDELSHMKTARLYVRSELGRLLNEIAPQIIAGGWTGELTGLRKDGAEFPLMCSCAPIYNEQGQVVFLIAVYRDIAEQKKAEAERIELERRAQLSSRLASVGEMASGIAHEINNPLTGVIGYAQLLMEKDLPKDIKGDLKVINDGAQRVADIVRRMLSFARQHKPERTYTSINEIIESTLKLRTYALETSNIEVNTRLDPDLPATMADAGQLQQVFLNLIVNAETEMKLAHGRGKLSIKTEKRDNTIRISFRDDGPGIAKKNLDKIFDPFFTTREVGQGTGLGLSMCHGIVTEHNGRIYARSRLGKGATFIVELPIVAEEKQLEMAEPVVKAEKVAGARILAIDDEPTVLQYLSQVLTDEGHKVETVDNADDALRMVKNNRYNLILSDIKLPSMSGIELYKELQKVAKSLAKRVVFITGDVMGTDTRDFLLKTKAPYITKPFDAEELKWDINRILAEAA